MLPACFSMPRGGHGVWRRQRLAGPHRVCGARRSRLQHRSPERALLLVLRSAFNGASPPQPSPLNHSLQPQNTKRDQSPAQIYRKNNRLFIVGRAKPIESCRPMNALVTYTTRLSALSRPDLM